MKGAGFNFIAIPAGKWRRYFDLRNILDLFMMVFGFLSAFLIIIFFWPDKVFIKGGYVGVPVGLAAWILGRPIILHESDSVMGIANKILARFAKQIYVSFPVEAYSNSTKLIYTGVPISDVFYLNESGNLSIELIKDKPLILVMGGSQGARAINILVKKILSRLLEKYQVVHLTGKLDYPNIKQWNDSMSNKGYYLFDVLPNTQVASLMKKANLIISRAGATTIAEISVVKKPAILIPLPGSANNHQHKNAEYLAAKEAALMLNQDDIDVDVLIKTIDKLFNSDLSKRLSFNISAFAKPEAADKIAELLLT